MNPETRNATIVWCVSPVALIILCLVSLWLGTYSILTIIIIGLFVLAYGLVTFRFLRCLYRSDIASNTSWVRMALGLAVVIPIAYFAFRQFSPIRILYSKSSPSIFDAVSDSADQIAYGYPSPFLRFFDVADQIHGKTLIDWGSLLIIVWVVLLFVFLLLACIGLTLKFTTKK
jgi:hypothetical protein